MKLTGIIAEYNPFHNGHAYHIDRARTSTGADAIAVVMSGDFVQRGEPACTDKFTRAGMALSCGADLVVELPARYSTSSAEFFALGAVSLLDGLGADTLCFGCETENLDVLRRLAEVLNDEPEDFSRELQRLLKQGLSFPKAREQALLALFPDDFPVTSQLLSSPNAILGIEYLKALLRLRSSMRAAAVLRCDAGYHSTAPGEVFSSATAIRSLLPPTEKSRGVIAGAIPRPARSLFFSAVDSHGSASLNDFSALLHYALLSRPRLADFPDISPELENRIYRLLPEYTTAEEFALRLKSRQLTLAMVKRSLLHVLLGIRREELTQNRTASYARILGVRRDFLPCLGELQQSSRIPLLLRLADGQKLLSPEAFQLLRRDLRASEIYHCCASSRPYNEYKMPLLVI